ncbi:hypothetical protein, partial [Ralstonia mannitolilytica]|uniref:hypothetical protein n=1 Tax=Ralstonia mannitolilytica TaxID=105219 RepID=UPI002931AD08
MGLVFGAHDTPRARDARNRINTVEKACIGPNSREWKRTKSGIPHFAGRDFFRREIILILILESHFSVAAARRRGACGRHAAGPPQRSNRCPIQAAESIIKCNTPDLPCTRPCRRPMGTRYQHLSAEERAT